MCRECSPLDERWYYVREFNDYFTYIEHRSNGILLDGGCCFGTAFIAPENCCRPATAEEVMSARVHRGVCGYPGR